MARAACIVSVVGLLLATGSAGARPLEEILREAKPAVVHLSIRNSRGLAIGSGSGFIISSTGKVATCHHVIDGARDVEAVFEDGARRPIVGIWASNPAADVAILQLPPGRYSSLPVATSAAQQGEPVTVIGSPLGFSGTVSTGIVSAIRAGGARSNEFERPEWQLQMTAAVSPGSSGSPILNQSGEVVGIAVGVVLRGQALNFGVPVSELGKLSASVGREPRPLSELSGRGVLTNLLISASGLGLAGALIWIYAFFSGRRERQKRRPRSLLGDIGLD